MKYNLLQKSHDKLCSNFENGFIDVETYFEYEKIILELEEIFTIYLN